jgi:hypothetical protein
LLLACGSGDVTRTVRRSTADLPWRLRRPWPACVLLAIAAVAPASCVVGDEDPGCRGDSECPSGFTCQAGACFRFTTDLSPPRDPGADAGSDGDAADGAGG